MPNHDFGWCAGEFHMSIPDFHVECWKLSPVSPEDRAKLQALFDRCR